MTAPDPIIAFKKQFVASERHVHLNNAGVAPICRPARDAMVRHLENLYQSGTYAVPEMVGALEKARESLGLLINAPTAQIALFQGAANAISQMAFGLTLQPGDEILLWDQEYPSNFYPWRDAAQISGAKIVTASSGENLATPLENLFARITSKTRVIALSWVQFQTGAITDLEPLTTFARQRGILTFADVIQGVGLLPFDFAASGLDAVVGGSHKWMVSPLGVGFLAAQPSVFDHLRPQAVGALTYGTPDDLPSMEAKPRTGPARYEPGSRPALEIIAYGAAIDLLRQTGMDRIAQEAEWLAKRLVQGLRERGYLIQSPHGPHHRGGIVNFKPSPTSRATTIADAEVALKAIGCSYAKRAGGIRLSPHAFNTTEDIDRVLGVL